MHKHLEQIMSIKCLFLAAIVSRRICPWFPCSVSIPVKIETTQIFGSV